MEEKEDSEMEEEGDTISQASHLELRKAVEKIGTDSATFVRCGTRLWILEIFAGPLLYEGWDKCAGHAEKQAEEQKYVNTDRRRGGGLGAWTRTRGESLVSLDEKWGDYRRKETSLVRFG
jgi:hypothetical protein